MCGLYYAGDEMLEEIHKLVGHVDRRFYEQKGRWSKDVHPTDSAPVIIAGNRDLGNRNSGSHSLGSHNAGAFLTLQRWGYPGIQNNVIINARQETLLQKKIFSNGIRYHRAVIPADHFYEWNANREKFTFKRPDSTPLFMAGFFDMMQNEERFVIITTEANTSMQPVHDRMPVILEKESIDDWLHDEKAALEIIKQTPLLLERETPYEQLSLF